MQVRAIIEAAVNCEKRGVKVYPEIMIPLTIDDKELSILIERTKAVADGILKEHRSKVKYLFGTMVETPRAALLADRMAHVAEFFSFGTNDLTQLTLALSRDDARSFLPDYIKAGIIEGHPFHTIDVDGVGMLLQIACKKGRAVRPKLKLGICGEHGGEPHSINFCQKIGLDYVSCSPFRVPVARLAAAQAAIAESKPKPRTRKAKPRAKPRAKAKAKPRAAGKGAAKRKAKKR
jgi:pyruvate,orthophosphate dikinase